MAKLTTRVEELTTLLAAKETQLAAAQEKVGREEENVERFRALYMEGTAFFNETRAENEALKQQAAIAESQARNGVALVRVEAEGRVAKLGDELKRERGLVALLTERARRTDDIVRQRAALEPEWKRRIGLL
ncbi:hypothetical protein K488DRAFT_56180, partial [Vararia minispora EC-137]